MPAAAELELELELKLPLHVPDWKAAGIAYWMGACVTGAAKFPGGS